ncbi:MAG TPA: DUF167 domain-containing protein [Caldisericia bacterium]|nr:DUF167 domain-containing protein [Caldisericia bacterium]HOL82762.1 DUF167 domain-containing protein [Caldisericia bacterium]HON82593.1 DUF167 domain-containing protein [Caldisericia bacterium]HPC57094.1 DUF167 domain-containing protein [Caldisericia bacterium]HPP44035.1 DUF167 domain-containing protein [Caldisericia bacterium]
MNLIVKVTPNSKKNSIKEYKDNVLYINISKPPVENKANDELIKFLEDILNIKGIKIISGQKSKNKLLYIPLEEKILKEKIEKLLR